MTTKKVTMQKIKDVLRLKYGADLSLRQISKSLNLSTGVISKYINRADAAGLNWPLPESMTEHELAVIMQPK
jgi:DNA-binding transcriptional regulator LsrR (DeoR family)